ncbi:hypothetical protein Tco_0976632 [Tanacetum coccineum]|uniref:Uncharacterized protein n=1 Tax=Tanacetum coccineum TaxID=301880 RepID=A0ABQ5EHS2_9ASTR
MSSNTPDYIYPIIVPSDVDVEDAFSSTHSPDYIPASPDYFPASPGNTSPDSSDDLSKSLEDWEVSSLQFMQRALSVRAGYGCQSLFLGFLRGTRRRLCFFMVWWHDPDGGVWVANIVSGNAMCGHCGCVLGNSWMVCGYGGLTWWYDRCLVGNVSEGRCIGLGWLGMLGYGGWVGGFCQGGLGDIMVILGGCDGARCFRGSFDGWDIMGGGRVLSGGDVLVWGFSELREVMSVGGGVVTLGYVGFGLCASFGFVVFCVVGFGVLIV